MSIPFPARVFPKSRSGVLLQFGNALCKNDGLPISASSIRLAAKYSFFVQLGVHSSNSFRTKGSFAHFQENSDSVVIKGGKRQKSIKASIQDDPVRIVFYHFIHGSSRNS